MNPIIAVLFLAVAANANHPLPGHMNDIINTEGAQYKLYETYTKSITLDSEDQKHTFDGLNIHGNDNVVDKKDLELFYWHEDLYYAIPKFIKFIDDNNDSIIHMNELQDEFQEKPVRVALIECHYLKSPGLKQSCFADQLLTYGALFMENDDVKSFYEHLGGTDGISKEEAESINHPKNKDKKVTAEELGAYSGGEGVTLAEFTDYVTQESINDDFRRCRKGTPDVNTGNVDFNNDCLLEELTEYTNEDLTEMDMSVMFRSFDLDGKDGITKAELAELPGVKGAPDADVKVDKIMKLLDMSLTTHANAKPVVDYGEFRTYMKSPTVQLQAERECIEPIDSQKAELECLYNFMIRSLIQEHDAIWLFMPDLEQQIYFETLDTSNDGEIKKAELTFADDKAEERLIKEMDHDNSEYICLEEWNEYMDIPHMVYGTADCLLKPRSKEGRGHCSSHEIELIFSNIKHFDDDFWTKWFKHYDSNKDNIITAADDNEAAHKFGSQDLENLFLSELGQGDSTVTLFEFKWYVKQQALAERYEEVVNAGKKEDLNEFHKLLMKYIQDDLTEYDSQEFFDGLDVDNNHELDEKDFGQSLWPKMKDLIKKIDGVEPNGDADSTVNFREFWLWLNYQTNPGQAKKVLIKHTFENECTKKINGKDQQKLEIECYIKYFKEHAENLAKLC